MGGTQREEMICWGGKGGLGCSGFFTWTWHEMEAVTLSWEWVSVGAHRVQSVETYRSTGYPPILYHKIIEP